MKRNSWEIARCGQRPISKERLSVGKIMQVSWPPMDKPSIGYPSMVNPLAFLGAKSGSELGFGSLLLLPVIDRLTKKKKDQKMGDF